VQNRPETRGAAALVREGEQAFAGARAIVEEHGPLPCTVEHPDAGGRCERPAVMEVYGLPFCEVHGEEIKAGALQELYFDATHDVGRPLGGHVAPLNPEAERALQAALSGLLEKVHQAERADDEALLRAYPLIRERVSSETLHFDYSDPSGARGTTPVELFMRHRELIHKLMRLAHEEGAGYLVETLEDHRESCAAQLAFALTLAPDHQEHVETNAGA
jgi:hypothetical protein